MSERKLMSIDIEPSVSESQSDQQQRLRARSENSFKFNFLPDNCADSLNQASLPSAPEDTVRDITFTGTNENFVFNFQIDREEEMEKDSPTSETSPHKPLCAENPSVQQCSSTPDTVPTSTRPKKKKRTGRNKAANGNTKEELKEAAVHEGETAELSTEEQFQRQLDWCIEHLDLGMRSHKATLKQKEEASRALKTLRSSKAPLVKKRQLMRAMAGDYRQKMEEEKCKQFSLIQNETASAQLRAVSVLPKKSSFHRKALIKAQTPQGTDISDATEAPNNNFVLTPSNEEFLFNFL
ncbi:unnamed protein product [Knipowitschia caucasica]|uniref:Uncharacterized protein n=1 Tax=Knipowitschia caucasica TaxID=637954 RepID=A0AAV2LA26_KNICA